MTGLGRRLLVLALIGALAAAFQVARASAAAPSFFVGTDEDALLWGNSQQTATLARTLGLRSIRITLQWRPGQTQLAPAYRRAIAKLLLDTWGIRVVVSVYGRAEDAPRTSVARGQYCSYVADLLRSNPEIDDVAIWNDPNDGTFWMPQFGPNGVSTSPADYEALLAECWDDAHAVRKTANVIAVAVSKSTSIPGAFTLAWHPPAIWFNKLGAAYKASRRTQPIFDTLGYIPHPASAAERPWTKHPGSSAISLGDYDALMATLTAAFRGTGQPLPSQSSPTIWYLTQGYQTAPDPARAASFTGSETDPSPLPSWSPAEAADTGTGPGLDQPVQLADAIRVAYCQPNVGAYFNFHLFDERDLAGWQSGVLWPDGTPKAAYQTLRRAAGEVNQRAINCAAFSPAGVPPRPAPVAQPAQVKLEIANLHRVALGAFGGTVAWKTTVPAKVQVGYGLSDYGAPTVWAPVDDTGEASSASLVGLDSNSTYRVWLNAVSDDGQRAETTLDVTTPGLPAHPTVTLGRSPGAITLDGYPFFPMILYSVCPNQYGAALASGINLFALNACGTFQAQLNALGGAAFSTGVAGGSGGDGTGQIGWFHYDEPDGTNIPASSLPGPPPGVPNFSFLTLTNHFYSGAGALPWGRGAYPSLIAKADVVGFDLYPLQEWCRPNRMADVFLAQRELVKLSGEKPTFQWIEAAPWKCFDGANAVTPATVRAESWLAIAGGARGLGFWPPEWNSAVSRVISGVRRDVARLGPAIYLPDQAASDNNPNVQISARSGAGALYVFAVNASYQATDATITVGALNGRALLAMGESRRVNSDGDVFSDHFAPLGVHIYIAAPAGG